MKQKMSAFPFPGYTAKHAGEDWGCAGNDDALNIWHSSRSNIGL